MGVLSEGETLLYNVSYSISDGQTSGSTIGDEHFGTNYLFHHDRVDEDSTFPVLMDEIGINHVRYPGGTVTEHFFDISNPDAETQQSIIDDSIRAVEPISDFLNYVQSTGATAIIVIPTYRFFDTKTGAIDPAAEEVVKAFVRDVLAGVYGDAKIHGFEIGNEWYQENFDWTASEFGAVQSQIALWIDEVIQENSEWSEVGVYVQSGRGDDDHNGIHDDLEISQQFNQAELDAIDGVIQHIYASTSSDNPLILGGNIPDRLGLLSQHWDTDSASGLDIVISEWNVGDDGPDNTSISGLMRGVALLNVFSNMMEAGVDIAAIWTAQAPSPSGLGTVEGENGLTVTGQLYQMMYDALIDTRVVSIEGSDKLVDAEGNGIGRTYVFQGDGKTIIYIASGVSGEINVSADLGLYTNTNSHISATVLGVVEGSEPTDFRAVPEIQEYNIVDGSGSGSYTFHLDPFEVIQIVITENPERPRREKDKDELVQGSDTADELDGGRGDDSLLGASGNDTLKGGAGIDHLKGSNGNDTLSGDRNDDTLSGGRGNDLLKGGTGNDLLNAGINNDRAFGGLHNDTINGGKGNDLLNGGGGSDRLNGGKGDDRLNGGNGNDTLNGGKGGDLLKGGKGEDLLNAGRNDDRAFGGDHNDTLNGGHGNDLLSGGMGSDRLNGGSGDDTLKGGKGSDTFEFEAAGDSDIILDFDLVEDVLHIDRDLVSEHVTAREIVSLYGTIQEDGVLLDFGDGDELLLHGVSNMNALSDQIEFI